MVMPRDSIGPATTFWIFCAVETLAMMAGPKPLTAVWRRMEPIAVMENWNAIGRPTPQRRAM